MYFQGPSAILIFLLPNKERDPSPFLKSTAIPLWSGIPMTISTSVTPSFFFGDGRCATARRFRSTRTRAPATSRPWRQAACGSAPRPSPPEASSKKTSARCRCFVLFVCFFRFFSVSETAVFLFVSSFRASVFLIVCTNEFMHPLILWCMLSTPSMVH